MQEIHTSLAGNVAGEPRVTQVGDGITRAVLRVAVTPRLMDREGGGWRDGPPSFVNVVCWRALAENVAASVHKGEPVVVTGRLRVAAYTAADDRRRQSVEIHATAVGHDLARGRSRFGRVSRAPVVPEQATPGAGPPGSHPDDAAHAGPPSLVG